MRALKLRRQTQEVLASHDKLRINAKLQRENQALCAPLLGMQLHTQRYPRRIQDFPHILRLTRDQTQVSHIAGRFFTI